LVVKNNKLAGMDNILAECMKHGGEIMVLFLTPICNKARKSEEVPEGWKNGIIQPLPKMGDLTHCTNWRVYNLLSIPGEVMAKVLLNRMRSFIDMILRPYQAGFQTGRSCREQILHSETICR